MDRDRIRLGIALVREITASKIRQANTTVKAHDLQTADLENYSPIFYYNGIPAENAAFRRALQDTNQKWPKTKLDTSKILIADTFLEPDGTPQLIRHTLDQVVNFFQEVEKADKDPSHPLHGRHTVALVSNIEHFVRIPHYLNLYNKKREEEGKEPLQFWAYGLRTREVEAYQQGTYLGKLPDVYQKSEIDRLITYAEQGHLDIEPAYFRT